MNAIELLKKCQKARELSKITKSEPEISLIIKNFFLQIFVILALMIILFNFLGVL
jgi:hypothetical protein